jgi:hypothetical protein
VVIGLASNLIAPPILLTDDDLDVLGIGIPK